MYAPNLSKPADFVAFCAKVPDHACGGASTGAAALAADAAPVPAAALCATTTGDSSASHPSHHRHDTLEVGATRVAPTSMSQLARHTMHAPGASTSAAALAADAAPVPAAAPCATTTGDSSASHPSHHRHDTLEVGAVAPTSMSQLARHTMDAPGAAPVQQRSRQTQRQCQQPQH